MPFTPEHALVWCEIPVRDLASTKAFYEAVFGYQMAQDDSGPNPILFLPWEGDGIAGHLYPGVPAEGGKGTTVHLAVPDTVEATQARVREAGGTLLGPVIEIPPGRFAYAQDPDGNSIALFEARAA